MKRFIPKAQSSPASQVRNVVFGSLVMFKLFAGGVLAASEAFPENRLTVKGGRFLTLNTVIRVNQIEAARDVSGLRAV